MWILAYSGLSAAWILDDGDPARFDELWRTTRSAGDNFLSIKASFWVPVVFGGR